MKEIKKAINNWVKKNKNNVIFLAGFVSFKDKITKKNIIKEQEYLGGAFDKDMLNFLIDDVKKRLIENNKTNKKNG